jgi:hypothetical protein
MKGPSPMSAVARIPHRGHHDRMIELGARSHRRRSRPAGRVRLAALGAVAALASLVALVAATAAIGAAPPGAAGSGSRPQSGSTAQSLSAWTGGINLYRDGVFTTQASWLYCTAADVQILKNMIEGTEDHSSAAQTTYFDWMRTRNRYDLPLSAGVDPAGWTAGMRHFVHDRYRLVSSDSFGYSLQLAVTRMRVTNMPVALAVAHGNHGWVLNGFTATADPAATTDFEITGVSVTGPLWGLQSKNGYDMPPNTTLTVDQLRTYFTRWHYDPLPMIWDGTFVSIQPLTDEELAAATPAPTPAPPTPAPPTPRPTPRSTPLPTPRPQPTPAPMATAAPAPTPTATAAPAPTPTATAYQVTESPRVAAAGSGSPPPTADPATPIDGGTTTPGGLSAPVALGLALASLAVLGAVAWRRRSHRTGSPAA